MPKARITNVRKNRNQVWNRLLDLAGSRGINVIKTNFPSNKVRGSFIRYKGDQIIFLNSQLKGTALNFVFAHELGHAVLHGWVDRDLYFEDKELHNDVERQANRFAHKLMWLLERGCKENRLGLVI